MPRRVSTQTTLEGGAKAAIARAQDAEGFDRAPTAQGRSGGDDLYELLQELFERDELRDDGALEEARGELRRESAEHLEAGVEAAQELVSQGRADGWRYQQGGVVATQKGRIVKWTAKAARTAKGTIADTALSRAVAQRERLAHRTYERRVRLRLEAIGRSMFGPEPSAGQMGALIEAFKADRRRRGWTVPDL